mgnify:CR=1 FL=1
MMSKIARTAKPVQVSVSPYRPIRLHPVQPVPSDIAIAQAARMKKNPSLAREAGILPEELEP